MSTLRTGVKTFCVLPWESQDNQKVAIDNMASQCDVFLITSRGGMASSRTRAMVLEAQCVVTSVARKGQQFRTELGKERPAFHLALQQQVSTIFGGFIEGC